jgi:hypothetical protein
MKTLAVTSGAIHGLSLAVAYGGPVFALKALNPALKKIASHAERGQVLEEAWRRFGKIDLAAHVGFAASWLVLRTMLKSLKLNKSTKRLIVAKDILVGGALVTGVAAAAIGRIMRKGFPGMPMKTGGKAGPETPKHAKKLLHAQKALGMLNLVLVKGSIAVSPAIAINAMHARKKGLLARAVARMLGR